MMHFLCSEKSNNKTWTHLYPYLYNRPSCFFRSAASLLSSITYVLFFLVCSCYKNQNYISIIKYVLGRTDTYQTGTKYSSPIGWLFYNNHLSDRDLKPIIKDYISAGRPLERFFREVHEESWRIKLQTKSI